MNEDIKNKITRFINDEAMSNAVKGVLLDSFMKPQRDSDVYKLAASRIAIDLLNESWRDLKKYGSQVNENIEKIKQIGL